MTTTSRTFTPFSFISTPPPDYRYRLLRILNERRFARYRPILDGHFIDFRAKLRQ